MAGYCRKCNTRLSESDRHDVCDPCARGGGDAWSDRGRSERIEAAPARRSSRKCRECGSRTGGDYDVCDSCHNGSRRGGYRRRDEYGPWAVVFILLLIFAAIYAFSGRSATTVY